MEWQISRDPVEYAAAVAAMEARAGAIRDGAADELVWLLEHPPLYTAGTSARDADLLEVRFPVFRSGRGGEYTYHGPGQRVAYVVADLRQRQAVPDLKKYVWQLEEWVIRTLSAFGVAGERRAGRVGIWVVAPDGGEAKIAAIGVRVRRWVAYHGVAINVDPDLTHFEGIVPCGIREHGVTSLRAVLGRAVPMDEIDTALRSCWDGVFEESAKAAA